MSEQNINIDPVEEYCRTLSEQIPPLAEGEADRLTAEMLSCKEEAKQRLIEAHLPMVVSIAKGFAGRGILVLDLIEEGNTALIKAADTYNYNCGRSFSMYAADAVRRAIIDVFASACIDRRIPVAQIEMLNKVNRAYRELEQEYGRIPTVHELAHHMGLPEIQLERLIPVVAEPAPIPDNYDLIDNANLTDEQKEKLTAIFDRLTPLERKVIAMRYGLTDGKPHTLEEIAGEFGVTRERIRQLEAKAMRKAKPRATRTKKLKDFLND